MRDILEKRLREILEYIGINPSVSIEDGEDNYLVKIEGEDLSFLIGYRGESLNALQAMLGSMLFSDTGEWAHVVVDINNYRESRKDRLEEMARNFIDRARFHQKEVRMPPMNSFERRQVHMLLAEYPDVESESTGEGRDRRIVLKLSK